MPSINRSTYLTPVQRGVEAEEGAMSNQRQTNTPYWNYIAYGVTGFLTVILWYEFIDDTVTLFGGQRWLTT